MAGSARKTSGRARAAKASAVRSPACATRAKAGVAAIIRLPQGLSDTDKVKGIVMGTAEADAWAHRPDARRDYADLVTPDIQAKIDAALAGMKDGSVDPCKPRACDDKS